MSLASFALLLLCCLATVSECVRYSAKYKSGDVTFDPVKRPDDNDDRIENYWPVKLFNCVGGSGVDKCLKIFLIKRMDHVVDVLNRERNAGNVSIEFDLVGEIRRQFRWEQYKNVSDSNLNKLILRNLKSIFAGKKTKLMLSPGIDVEVQPDANGTMYLNIKKDADVQLPRGMGFSKKTFYRIIPVLLIPPLIMSAIFPFILPAMKIMIIWVSMLNQMALTGAVFTLMRNNAFNDNTHKKVIYVNDGYKNEKPHHHPPPPLHHHPHPHHHHHKPPPSHSSEPFFPEVSSYQHQELENYERYPPFLGGGGGLDSDGDFDGFSPGESHHEYEIRHPQQQQQIEPQSGPFIDEEEAFNFDRKEHNVRKEGVRNAIRAKRRPTNDRLRGA